MRYSLDVNRAPCNVEAAPGTPLLTILRENLALRGARFGCGEGECGACVVLLDGEPKPSCKVPVEAAAGHAVRTVEGLATGSVLHRVQQAFVDEGAFQCGYCTSGMIVAAVALLERVPVPTEAQIREALAPHLCRCGVYLRAIRAVQRASR